MSRLYLHRKWCHHLNLFSLFVYPGSRFLSIGWMGQCNSVETQCKVFYTSAAGKMERKTRGSNKRHESVSNLSSGVVESHVAMRQGRHCD